MNEAVKDMRSKAKTKNKVNAVRGEMFSPHVYRKWADFCWVCKKRVKPATVKSDLLLALACFDQTVSLILRKDKLRIDNLTFPQFLVSRMNIERQSWNIFIWTTIKFLDDPLLLYLDE